MRVLLTGMSGSGKSTLVAELSARGHQAIDLDDPAWSEYRALSSDEVPPGVQPGRDWVWREARVHELLTTTAGKVLFAAGCAANQGHFRTHFDHVVLLTAPVEVTLERLATRTTNPFGKDPAECAKILADKAAFEPILRQSADLELETTEPLATTVQRLVDLVRR